MAYVLLGLSLVVGLGLMGRWLLDTEPRVILRVARWVGLGALAAGGLFVLFRGRLDWVLYAATVLLPFAVRWGGVARMIRNAAKAARGPTPGQSSGVRTRFLAMSLDHDTGRLDGEVLEGRLAGRRLSELTQDECNALREEAAEDPASVQVLDAWLERAGDGAGAGAGETAGARPGGAGAGDPGDGTMTRARALQILGLSEGAAEDEIREAHRRLMMANHPDKGGSSWLAAQINRAKDMLLGRP